MIPTNLEAAAVEAKFAIQQALEKLNAKCHESGFDFDFEPNWHELQHMDGTKRKKYFVSITIKKEF